MGVSFALRAATLRANEQHVHLKRDRVVGSETDPPPTGRGHRSNSDATTVLEPHSVGKRPLRIGAARSVAPRSRSD
jgi:hypothetical protein